MLKSVFMLLLVRCSLDSVAALTCRSCIDITQHDKTMADFGNPSWAIEDDDCRKSYQSTKQPDRKCEDQDEVCAAIFFADNLQNTILLQTCLLIPDVKINVTTDVYFIGPKHENSVREAFPGFFDKRASITVKMNFCNTDICFPPSGMQAKVYSMETNQSSQILQSLYDKVAELSSAVDRNDSVGENNLNVTHSTTSQSISHSTFNQTTVIFVQTPQPATTENLDNVSLKTFDDLTGISNFTEPIGINITSNISGAPPTSSNPITKTGSSIPTSAVPGTDVPTFQARSSGDANSRNLEAASVSKPDLSLLMWVSVPFIGLFVLAAIFALYLMQRYKTKAKNEIEKEFTRFLDGRVRRNTIFFKNNKDGFDGTYNREVFEIPVSSLKIDESKILDCDEYEKVCYGKVVKSGSAIEVAAKMPKVPATPEATMIAVRKLVQEIKVLSYVGIHENVIRFIGAYTENLRNGCVCVFVELCYLGGLQNHLTNLRIKIPSGVLDATIAQKLQK